MKPDDRSPQSSSQLTGEQGRAVVELVQRRPGLTGREIASELNLEKRRVNAFLYDEGRKKYGLDERNWRWSARGQSENPAPALQRLGTAAHSLESKSEPHLEDSMRKVDLAKVPRLRVVSEPASRGICKVLLQIPEARALKQISRMEIDAIDRACGEDDYPCLGENLQIALANRRASLVEKQEELRLRRSTTLWGWLLRAC
ncbi:hypothetical protein NZK32_08645 [Cyanobium sp. FGCU-52]|nr:hypothetical protein [Cyanobium sp. FGCU52]